MSSLTLRDAFTRERVGGAVGEHGLISYSQLEPHTGRETPLRQGSIAADVASYGKLPASNTHDNNEKEEEEAEAPVSVREGWMECVSRPASAADWGSTGKPWVNASLQKYYTRLEFHTAADDAEEEQEVAAYSKGQAQLQGECV